jgi:hypothetical protein
MSGRLPGDHYVLTGDDIGVVVAGLELAQRQRRADGLPRSPRLDELIRHMSGRPQSDIGGRATRETRRMSIGEVAGLLGVSERHARRLAPQLGGVRIAGRWHLDPDAVGEHIRGGTGGNKEE